MTGHDDDAPAPHHPRNRRTSESKLRRGGRHCPLCLAPLRRNAPRTRLMRGCGECRARLSREKRCRRCGAAAVRENREGAACRGCGLHGAKNDVILPA